MIRKWAIVALALNTAPAMAEDGLFETLQANCGKAFEGFVSRGAADDPWRSAKLVAHVRDCSDSELKVPLAFNDDHSRIWMITRQVDGGLQLKHDHRHADGSEDAVTQYGGRTVMPDGAAGDREVNFHVDGDSIAMFKREGLNASLENVWQMSVAGDMLNYRLTRPGGRDFMVSFDLTKPVGVPGPAWDKVGN